MSLDLKRLVDPVQLTTSYVTQYTVGSGKKSIIKEIVLANTTGSPVTVNISLVPSGGAAGATKDILGGTAIEANATHVIELHTVMHTGDFISAKSNTGAAINLIVSGVEEA